MLVICLIKPQLRRQADVGQLGRSASRALPDLLPPLIIFLAVIGSIYAGWATATEVGGARRDRGARHRRLAPAG